MENIEKSQDDEIKQKSSSFGQDFGNTLLLLFRILNLQLVFRWLFDKLTFVGFFSTKVCWLFDNGSFLVFGILLTTFCQFLGCSRCNFLVLMNIDSYLSSIDWLAILLQCQHYAVLGYKIDIAKTLANSCVAITNQTDTVNFTAIFEKFTYFFLSRLERKVAKKNGKRWIISWCSCMDNIQLESVILKLGAIPVWKTKTLFEPSFNWLRLTAKVL